MSISGYSSAPPVIMSISLFALCKQGLTISFTALGIIGISLAALGFAVLGLGISPFAVLGIMGISLAALGFAVLGLGISILAVLGVGISSTFTAPGIMGSAALGFAVLGFGISIFAALGIMGTSLAALGFVVLDL